MIYWTFIKTFLVSVATQTKLSIKQSVKLQGKPLFMKRCMYRPSMCCCWTLLYNICSFSCHTNRTSYWRKCLLQRFSDWTFWKLYVWQKLSSCSWFTVWWQWCFLRSMSYWKLSLCGLQLWCINNRKCWHITFRVWRSCCAIRGWRWYKGP